MINELRREWVEGIGDDVFHGETEGEKYIGVMNRGRRESGKKE